VASDEQISQADFILAAFHAVLSATLWQSHSQYPGRLTPVVGNGSGITNLDYSEMRGL
jgi:hypothetical protein